MSGLCSAHLHYDRECPRCQTEVPAWVAELEQSLAHERELREAAEAERHHLIHGDMVRTSNGSYICGLDKCAFHKDDPYKLVEGNRTAGLVCHTMQCEHLTYEHGKQDATHNHITRLLAALTQQRQALELISNPERTVFAGGSYWEIARAALATDHAALLAEGESLGVTP